MFQSQTGVYRVGILNLTLISACQLEGEMLSLSLPESVIPATDWTPLDAYIVVQKEV